MKPPTLIIIASALSLALFAPGCRSARSSSPYAAEIQTQRDSLKAQRLTQQAAELMDTKPDKAEMLLREALTADSYHGPAHNNLGVLHLKRGELYQAASEFERARKLMPGHPDPRVNLALTLEKAGRTSDALAGYQSTLDVYPEHIQTIQALARLQVKTGRTNDRTPGYLREIALRGENEGWRNWAAALQTE